MSQDKKPQWTGKPRCGKMLKIPARNNTRFLPGEYPCTKEKGHKPANEHTIVITWKDEPHL